MATAIGDRFVRRHSAAETLVSNTVAADRDFDTPVLSEGGYSWTTPNASVDTAGLYLVTHSVLARAGTTARSKGYDELLVNGVSQGLEGRTSTRYVRLSGGADENVSMGAALLDLASGDTVGSRRSTTGIASGLGEYSRNLDDPNGLQLVRLPSNDVTHLTLVTPVSIASDDTLTRPNLDNTDVWTAINWETAVSDPGSRWSAASPAAVSLALGDKVLVCATFQNADTGAGRHAIRIRANWNGVPIRHGTTYHKDSNTKYGWTTLVFMVEAGVAADITFEAIMEDESGDLSGTVDAAVVKVVTLDTSAEWLELNMSVDWDTAFTSTTTHYTVPFDNVSRASTGWSLSANGALNGTGAVVGALVLGNFYYDRNQSTNGARKVPIETIFVGGVEDVSAVSGEYSRGQQGADDCFHAGSTLVSAVDIPNAQILDVRAIDYSAINQGSIGIYASNNNNYGTLQLLDLSTLSSGGSITGTATQSFGGAASASGETVGLGSVSGAFGWAGGSFGTRITGTVLASQGFIVTSTAVGDRRSTGSASQSFNATGTVVGERAVEATSVTGFGGAFSASGNVIGNVAATGLAPLGFSGGVLGNTTRLSVSSAPVVSQFEMIGTVVREPVATSLLGVSFSSSSARRALDAVAVSRVPFTAEGTSDNSNWEFGASKGTYHILTYAGSSSKFQLRLTSSSGVPRVLTKFTASMDVYRRTEDPTPVTTISATDGNIRMLPDGYIEVTVPSSISNTLLGDNWYTLTITSPQGVSEVIVAGDFRVRPMATQLVVA